MEHVLVLEFKDFEYTLEESGRYRVECIRTLRSLVSIKRMDILLNGRVRDLRFVKWMNERSGQSAVRWFCHVKLMDNSRIAKRLYER